MNDVSEAHKRRPMRKLTEAQRRALSNLAKGRRIDDGISGRSAYGGLSQTVVSLHKRQFIDRNGDITPSGRLALAEEERH